MGANLKKVGVRALWLGAALTVLRLASSLWHVAKLGDPCCSVVTFDLNTRVVTVRQAGSGDTYPCVVPADQETKDLKAGAKVDLNMRALKDVQPGEKGSSAAVPTCGDWKGPRGANTVPKPPTKLPAKES